MKTKIKQQKKRNTKSFKKNLKKKSTNQSFVRDVSIDLPRIELGLTVLNPKRSLIDKMYDSFSNSMGVTVKQNWKKHGVPLFNLNKKNIDSHTPLENDIKYNSDIFQKYGSRGKFYHLTSPKNYQKIIKEGLKSTGVNRMTSMGTSNKIWTIESDSPLVWNQIGYSQLGVGVPDLKMVVLEIDPKGINGKITSEDLNEFTSPLHSVIHQTHIEPKFIHPIGYFNSSRNHFYTVREEFGKLKSTLYSKQLKMVG
jgi:hypothetical protein